MRVRKSRRSSTAARRRRRPRDTACRSPARLHHDHVLAPLVPEQVEYTRDLEDHDERVPEPPRRMMASASVAEGFSQKALTWKALRPRPSRPPRDSTYPKPGSACSAECRAGLPSPQVVEEACRPTDMADEGGFVADVVITREHRDGGRAGPREGEETQEQPGPVSRLVGCTRTFRSGSRASCGRARGRWS